jgi:ABC-2 type transport system ATP-binding protein
MTALARLSGVTRRFGDHTALDAVDLVIDPGAVVGLLGPNGAGKTTLLSLLQGRRRPTSGTVELFGGDPGDPARRAALGSTPQETALPHALKVHEVIDFVGAHFPDRIGTAELADEFGFADLLRRQCGALSGGQKRRVAVALAFVGSPRLVLLDEPTTGLDVDARHALWDAVRRQHARGATVVVTSHYLEEIEALAERVVVLAEGRVVADDALEAVLARAGSRLVRLTSPDLQRIAALPQVIRHDAGTFTVTDADAFLVDLVHSGAPFRDLEVRRAGLEEAFLALTESSAPSSASKENV